MRNHRSTRSSFARAAVFSVAIIAFCAHGGGADLEIGWEPAKTWVMAVGVLEWSASDLYGSFPKAGRRDAELVQFFRDQGVPGSQIVFLKDKLATKVRIERSLVDLLDQTRPGDLLVVYYAGHGVEEDGTTCFANYDITGKTLRSGWQVPAIFDAIERHYLGSRVLLMADACNSGALGVEAEKRGSKIAYATLASVQPEEESTGNWTFTECVLKGLRGDPAVDLNGDGQVQLDELARYTKRKMSAAESQKAWFSTANGFAPDMVLSLTKGARTAGVRVERKAEALWHGKWWPASVLQADNGKSLIHYDGYGAEWDEWVGADRLRIGK